MINKDDSIYPIAILDFEASSLSSKSYPIEAGWAVIEITGTITPGGGLIRPIASWTDWSNKAESLHGLSRALIEAHGISPRELVASINKAVAGMQVLSADPDYEIYWADRLFAAAGERRTWSIASLHELLSRLSLARSAATRAWLSDALAAPRPHRAQADAEHLAMLLSALLARE